ncbi:DUF4184 family protein [Streptomyces corynorhini]|uniref:DUF4184 family protein n=1 Tax=Streptomyces corynorhini TaxID=2282652 RepID=A0A370B746_9ACTN|nr:DUF4184 family protein [Streptomyces corynorhini]
MSHPAAVLPLLRRPFVPAALVAGSVAPDVPYFLGALGVAETSSADWYGPLLNATRTHSFVTGPFVALPFALGLVAAYALLRAPVTALLPPGLRPAAPERPAGARATARYAVWLLVSALIGIVSHLAWDSFTHGDGVLVAHVEPLRAEVLGGLTAARLLQYASTAFGLAACGRYLWRRRDRLRTDEGPAVARLAPVARWSVVALLVAAPVVGGAVHARADFHAYRHVTEVDFSRPTPVDLSDGTSETTYPERAALAPWGTVAEGVLTGAAKRAGGAFAAALLLYAAAWRLAALVRGQDRGTRGPEARDGEAPTPEARTPEDRNPAARNPAARDS